MPAWTDKRPIAIVSACMRCNGEPTFARNEVEVTQEEAENGVHYYLAEGQLLLDGYEEPFVHFAEAEAPAFLFPAVHEFLGLAPTIPEPTIHAYSEKSS